MRWVVVRSLAAVALAVLVACSEEAEPDLSEVPPEELYRRAEETFASSPARAAEAFEQVEQVHPYSPEAKISILRAGEAHFEVGRFEQAQAAAERFLSLHPGDDEAPRAQFILALSGYDRISDPSRSQAFTQQAEQELQELVTRYPESDFAREAEVRLDIVREQLAAHELHVARFYMRSGRFPPAINRLRTVVDEYPQTKEVVEALYRLVEANLALGLRDEARRAAAILGNNFPASPWYADAYALVSGLSAEEEG